MNSLLRFSKRTLDYSSLRKPYPTNYSYLVSGSFKLLLWILFSFSIAVLVHYRTWLVFRIGSRWDPCSGWKFDQPYSGYQKSSFWPSSTWVSHSVPLLSSRLRVNQLASALVQTPHCYCLSAELRFVLCCFHSPLLTASQLLSFPAVNKMFQFSAFAIVLADDY